LFADILEGEVELAGGILLNPRRDADAAGIGQRFEPGGDIDPVAENVAVFDDDVSDIDADAEFDPVFGRIARGPFGHRLLHLGRAAQRIDDADEFDQQPITGGLDYAAVMRRDGRVDQVGSQRLQPRERAFLVGSLAANSRPHRRREPRQGGGSRPWLPPASTAYQAPLYSTVRGMRE
jgi:hypothetical protein